MHEAARVFTEAVVRYVRERGATAAEIDAGEVKCTTCTAACCARAFNLVNVTPEDVARMGPELARQGVQLYRHGARWDGYVGELKRVPWQGEGHATHEDDDRAMACVFLDPRTSLCRVYDVRPGICSSYTSHDCDEHEEAPPRLVKLRRKEMAEDVKLAEGGS